MIKEGQVKKEDGHYWLCTWSGPSVFPCNPLNLTTVDLQEINIFYYWYKVLNGHKY